MVAGEGSGAGVGLEADESEVGEGLVVGDGLASAEYVVLAG